MIQALRISVLALVLASGSEGRQEEGLHRGLVAVRQQDGRVFVSWRKLKEDGDSGYRLYRVEDGKKKLIADKKAGEGTCDVDTAGAEGYFVRVVKEGKMADASKRAEVWEQGFLDIPLKVVEGYRAGDCSVGDLDGDGEYELVVHQVGESRDNSFSGVTSPPILDAYEMDGTFLWRIDLGINIREGEHYTQFMVFDLDGDGRAEVACKTADGTKDGLGKVIGDGKKDWRNLDEKSAQYGRILEGPEFLSVFDGKTGGALATVDYVPGRDPIDGWGGIGGNGNNDRYGNRANRFLACVAYLDGNRPSLVMARGVYGRTVLAAWDWRDGTLRKRWVFDSGISYPPFKDASSYSGMGGHGVSVADVDGDGKDEIVYQAMVIDDDGKGLYSTGRRHGDAMHVGDFDPKRPGLELFLVSENEGHTKRFGTPGAGMHDAKTGKVLWSHSPGVDVGSGVMADIDPRHAGAEAWGGPGGLRTVKGEEIGRSPRSMDWYLWWDGDLLREFYGGYRVRKWNWENEREEEIEKFESPGGGVSRRSLSYRKPNLAGDLLGDWREEVLVTAPDGKSLRLYTTTIPTKHALTCLMQDHQYRLAVAWQNVSYNKPPHPGFFLGEGKK